MRTHPLSDSRSCDLAAQLRLGPLDWSPMISFLDMALIA